MSLLEVVLALCLLLVTVGVVWLLVSFRRAVERLTSVLDMLEPELRRFIVEAHTLTEELRGLTREATRDLAEVGVATERLNAILGVASGIANVLGGMTRAGQIVSLALSIRKGVDVFVHRLRTRERMRHHGE